MTVGMSLPYVPLGTSQSRPRSGTNGLQQAGLQGRICSFLLSFIYSDALSLYRLRFRRIGADFTSSSSRSGDDDFLDHALRKL
jgi:hypothetical protein